jgi:hypothetical protein
MALSGESNVRAPAYVVPSATLIAKPNPAIATT